MLDTNLITQAERLAALYEKSSKSTSPYRKVRKLLQEAGIRSDSLVPDLDLYFSTLAGYCSWGKRLLTWNDEKVKTAMAYATQGFFEKHPEYGSLLPFIDQSDLNQGTRHLRGDAKGSVSSPDFIRALSKSERPRLINNLSSSLNTTSANGFVNSTNPISRATV